jgi:transcriptional regulator with XRE-family HTH domain
MAEQSALGFARLLRQLRAQVRLPQEGLAKSAGLKPRSIGDLERGTNRTGRRDTAELLANALCLAEPLLALFVAAARNRGPAVKELAGLADARAGHGPVCWVVRPGESGGSEACGPAYRIPSASAL